MTEPFDLDEPALRDRAVAAARGDAPFDLLITGAEIVDVALAVRRVADIGITGPLIASVHAPDQQATALDRIDASGMVISPGLIDAHMHVESSMVTPETYAGAVLPRGVTTIVWDPHEFGNVAGLAGVDYAIAAANRLDLRILTLAPSCVPSAPGYETAAADFGPEVMAQMMARPGIHGLAEVMDMAAVISRAPRMAGIVDAALRSGKMVCGHARSLSGKALQAYAAAGIGSDHEITSADDLMEKLATGLAIELRGSHPYLLAEFATALQALPQMPVTVSFCSDDVFPDDLLATGGVDQMLRTMVGHGLDPMRAVQAATLNAAIRLGRRDLGLIGAGKRADLAIFGDLQTFEARGVIANGKRVVAISEGSHVPAAFRKTCNLPPFDASSFMLPAKGPKVRLATIDKPRFTAWGEVEAMVESGHVVRPDDATMIAVINRHGGPTRPRLGYLRGWGRWDGAFASSVSHDCHNLTVFGACPADMAVAANAVAKAGGGMAVAHKGVVTALLALPVAGLVSEAPLEAVARDFTAVTQAMAKVVAWQPPFLTFKALVGATLACNAGPHQTDLGIADPLSDRLLPSPVLEDGLTS